MQLGILQYKTIKSPDVTWTCLLDCRHSLRKLPFRLLPLHVIAHAHATRHSNTARNYKLIGLSDHQKLSEKS